MRGLSAQCPYVETGKTTVRGEMVTPLCLEKGTTAFEYNNLYGSWEQTQQMAKQTSHCLAQKNIKSTIQLTGVKAQDCSVATLLYTFMDKEVIG